MSFSLSTLSNRKLVGVHPDLVAVVRHAIVITPVDFGVLEGVRTLERQRELVARGASQTMNSRHLTGHAVDLFAWAPDRFGKPGVSWDAMYYEMIAQSMFEASAKTNTPVEWGGNWKWFKDLTHFQLPWEIR